MELWQFFVQLFSIVSVVVGAMWRMYLLIEGKLKELNEKLSHLESRFDTKLNTEIARVNNRVDTLFIRMTKGTLYDTTDQDRG